MQQHNLTNAATSFIMYKVKRLPPRVFYCPPAPYAPIHKMRRWMSVAYHNRIQKKWNKRFGIKVVFVDRPQDPNNIYPELVGSGKIYGVTHKR